MPADTLPVKVRRTALQVLSRDRLKDLADRFELEVQDRRSAESYVDAFVRSRSLDFGDVLRAAKRDELKEICRALGLDDSGREIDAIVERILAMPSANAAQAGVNFALTPAEPRPARARARVRT